MKIIKRSETAQTAVARFVERFGSAHKSFGVSNTHQESTVLRWSPVCKQLLELTPPYDYKDIDRIIGNSSWTSLVCGECRAEPDEILHLGEEADYESSTLYICRDCLAKAGALMGVK